MEKDVKYYKRIDSFVYVPHSVSIQDRADRIEFNNNQLDKNEHWCRKCGAVVDADDKFDSVRNIVNTTCPFCFSVLSKYEPE